MRLTTDACEKLTETSNPQSKDILLRKLRQFFYNYKKMNTYTTVLESCHTGVDSKKLFNTLDNILASKKYKQEKLLNEYAANSRVGDIQAEDEIELQVEADTQFQQETQIQENESTYFHLTFQDVEFSPDLKRFWQDIRKKEVFDKKLQKIQNLVNNCPSASELKVGMFPMSPSHGRNVGNIPTSPSNTKSKKNMNSESFDQKQEQASKEDEYLSARFNAIKKYLDQLEIFVEYEHIKRYKFAMKEVLKEIDVLIKQQKNLDGAVALISKSIPYSGNYPSFLFNFFVFFIPKFSNF